MDSLPTDPILEFHPDTLQVVREMYNLDKPGEMDDAIDILDAWIKQQNHFIKKDYDRGYIERLIITSKGSVEKAKARLDKLCTLRILVPNLFGDYDVRKDFKNLHDVRVVYSPLPKLTTKHERVFLVDCPAKRLTTETILNGFRLCTMMAEYLKAHDYALSYMFVVDMRQCNVAEFLTKVNFMDSRNIMTLLTEGYGLRLSGIHLLTNMKIFDAFVMFLKQIMSEKIGNRIQVHRTLESLYEYAPKEVLPKEYGDGDEKRSLHEIHEKWMDVLSSEEYRAYQRIMNDARTDESKRPSDKFNDQYMGMPGTFRMFKLD